MIINCVQEFYCMLVNSGYVVCHDNILTYRHALFLLLLLASKKNKLNSRQRVICIDSACHMSNGCLRPCPHDTFPNWARSIAPSSRPVARVHTGATGTLVPDPRDHLSTWNEWARSIAIGCALSNLSCGRSSGRYRPVSKSAAVGTRLLDLLLPLLGTRALSRVFNRMRHVKADTRTLISKVLQSSKPYSHTNKINK